MGHSVGTDTTFKHYKSKITGAAAKKYYDPDNFTTEFMDFWSSLEGEEVYRSDKEEFETVATKYIEGVKKEINNTLAFGVWDKTRLPLMISSKGKKKSKTKKGDRSKSLFGMG